MPRGGRRAGKPGERYPNRTDLALAPRTAPTITPTGQAYGAATDNQALQQTVTAAQQATAGPQPSAAPVPRRLPPVDLEAPTEFPTSPVTGGLPIGPGPGPEALGLQTGGGGADLIALVEEAWRTYRDPRTLDLLMQLQEGM